MRYKSMYHEPKPTPFDAWGFFLGILELIGFFLALSWPLWLIPLLLTLGR